VYATVDISVDVSARQVKEALEALPNIEDVSVTRSSPSAFGGYSWNITFSQTGDIPVLSVYHDHKLHGTNAQVALTTAVNGATIPEVQNISSRVDSGTTIESGSFVLSWNGQTTSSIAYNATSEHLKAALDSLNNVGAVSVSSTDLGAGARSWLVTFLTESGDQNLLSVYSESISAAWSGNGDQLQISETNVGSVNLRSADLSSIASTDSATLTGSWGAHPPPSITSITAANGLAPGLSNNDTLTVVFDRDTNVPAVGSVSDINDLFAFTASLGSDYTGQWSSVTTLLITLVNTTAAGTSAQTRVNALQLTILAGGNLKSADLSSDSSTSSAVLRRGSWGNHSTAPSISSVVAADGGSAAGLNINDTLTVTFNDSTNVYGQQEFQTITSSASSPLGGYYQLIFNNENSSFIEHNASSNDVDTALEALTSVGVGGVSVTRSVEGPMGSYSWHVTFTNCRICFDAGDVPQIGALSSRLTGTAVAVHVSEVIKGNQLSKLEVDGLFSFSGNLGTDYSATWVSTSTLVLTIVNATNRASYYSLATNRLTVSVKSTADLRHADLYSPASTSQAKLSGTWGSFNMPHFVSALASNGGSAIDQGDVLEISFD
jgi:hypothetical protein